MKEFLQEFFDNFITVLAFILLPGFVIFFVAGPLILSVVFETGWWLLVYLISMPLLMTICSDE